MPMVRRTVLKEELAPALPEGAAFAYFDVQNPWYVTLLTTLLPAVMFAGAVLAWFSVPLVSGLLVLLGVVFALFNGGQRTAVTRQGIKVRYGIPGVTVLYLSRADIAGAEVHNFAPLRDFGGYGIRFNREMKACFLSGTRGVKLTHQGGQEVSYRLQPPGAAGRGGPGGSAIQGGRIGLRSRNRDLSICP